MSILFKVSLFLVAIGMFTRGMVYPDATPEANANAPSNICPECMVRLMMPPGNSEIQPSELADQFTSQISLLVNEAAAELKKPHSELYSELDAVVRARSRPRFDPSTLIDPAYTEEGKRLFDRMVLLLRKFIAAYVTAVAENGLESSSVETTSAVAAAQQQSTEAPLATPSATATVSKIDSSTHSTGSKKPQSSHSKSHSKSNDNDDDDDDDDDDNNDSEDNAE